MFCADNAGRMPNEGRVLVLTRTGSYRRSHLEFEAPAEEPLCLYKSFRDALLQWGCCSTCAVTDKHIEVLIGQPLRLQIRVPACVVSATCYNTSSDTPNPACSNDMTSCSVGSQPSELTTCTQSVASASTPVPTHSCMLELSVDSTGWCVAIRAWRAWWAGDGVHGASTVATLLQGDGCARHSRIHNRCIWM